MAHNTDNYALEFLRKPKPKRIGDAHTPTVSILRYRSETGKDTTEYDGGDAA